MLATTYQLRAAGLSPSFTAGDRRPHPSAITRIAPFVFLPSSKESGARTGCVNTDSASDKVCSLSQATLP